MTDQIKDILLVEDTFTQAMLLQHILQADGYAVMHAKNAEHALELLGERVPQLILTDINMPGMDGYQLTKHVKEQPEWQNIPVVLLVSMMEPADLLKIVDSGADNFILKIYDQEYFVPRLKSICVSALEPGTNAAADGFTTKVHLAGQEYVMRAHSHQLANMLVSAFDTAVYQNCKVKDGAQAGGG